MINDYGSELHQCLFTPQLLFILFKVSTLEALKPFDFCLVIKDFIIISV